ncbi:hypothetical protein [Bacillus safensis]|uniref:hypothetical protein n=1 Tax=Bacillus safensis TaxID=561879 RepID=UPI0004266BE8|nr:hypothetical protein [Bacillus safensis]
MSIKEALFLTEEAEKTLKEIEEMQERAMSENLERPLAFKIKYFLDSLNSSLDYAAYHTFEKYCLELATYKLNETQLSKVKRKIYFPSYKKEDVFIKHVDQSFIGLKENHQEIYDIFKKSQAFSSESTWLSDFKLLTNQNKHIKLTSSRKMFDGIIKRADIGNGVILENNVFINSGQPVSVNGEPLDVFNPQSNSFVRDFEGEFTSYYCLKGSHVPVVTVLNEYLTNIKNIVIEIDNYQ